MNKQPTRFTVMFWVVATLGIFVVQDMWVRSQTLALPYSQFQKLVRDNQVATVVVSADQVAGELKAPIDGKKRFATVRVDADMAR